MLGIEKLTYICTLVMLLAFSVHCSKVDEKSSADQSSAPIVISPDDQQEPPEGPSINFDKVEPQEKYEIDKEYDVVFIATDPAEDSLTFQWKIWGPTDTDFTDVLGHNDIEATPAIKTITGQNTLESRLSLRFKKTGIYSFQVIAKNSSSLTDKATSPALRFNEPAPIIGTLLVKSYPAGADILIDGASHGVTAQTGYVEVELEQGEYDLILSKEDYDESEPKPIRIEAGKKEYATIQLIKTPKNPAVVHISSQPSNAQIFLNNQYIGKTTSDPKTLEVLADQLHKIQIKLDGYETYEQDLNILENGQKTIFAELVKIPIPKGKLYVSATYAGATIRINGELKSETTPNTFELEAGTYQVEVTKDGYLTRDDGEAIVTPNGFKQIHATLYPPPTQYGKLHVMCTVACNVYVDGIKKFYKIYDREYSYESGKTYNIRLEAQGHDTYSEDAYIRANETYTIDKTLVANTGTINVTSSPSGHYVFLREVGEQANDFERLSPTPTTLTLEGRKTYVLELRGRDYKTFQKEVILDVGGEETVHAKLQKTHAWITFTSKPSNGYTINIENADGSEVYNNTTTHSQNLKEGIWNVTVSKKGFHDKTTSIKVVGGENKSHEITLAVKLKEVPIEPISETTFSAGVSKVFDDSFDGKVVANNKYLHYPTDIFAAAMLDDVLYYVTTSKSTLSVDQLFAKNISTRSGRYAQSDRLNVNNEKVMTNYTDGSFNQGITNLELQSFSFGNTKILTAPIKRYTGAHYNYKYTFRVWNLSNDLLNLDGKKQTIGGTRSRLPRVSKMLKLTDDIGALIEEQGSGTSNLYDITNYNQKLIVFKVGGSGGMNFSSTGIGYTEIDSCEYSLSQDWYNGVKDVFFHKGKFFIVGQETFPDQFQLASYDIKIPESIENINACTVGNLIKGPSNSMGKTTTLGNSTRPMFRIYRHPKYVDRLFVLKGETEIYEYQFSNTQIVLLNKIDIDHHTRPLAQTNFYFSKQNPFFLDQGKVFALAVERYAKLYYKDNTRHIKLLEGIDSSNCSGSTASCTEFVLGKTIIGGATTNFLLFPKYNRLMSFLSYSEPFHGPIMGKLQSSRKEIQFSVWKPGQDEGIPQALELKAFSSGVNTNSVVRVGTSSGLNDVVLSPQPGFVIPALKIQATCDIKNTQVKMIVETNFIWNGQINLMVDSGSGINIHTSKQGAIYQPTQTLYLNNLQATGNKVTLTGKISNSLVKNNKAVIKRITLQWNCGGTNKSIDIFTNNSSTNSQSLLNGLYFNVQ